MSIVIGLLAVAIGLLACFAGYRVFRIVLPVLGFIVGLGLGAQLALTFLGEPYLDSPLSWIIAIVVGVVLASIAFIWWVVSVALTVAGLGYAIGYGLAVGIEANTTLAVTIGAVVAVLFAVVAVALRVPTLIVIIMSALWGASALVGGALVLLGRIEAGELRNGTVDVAITNSPLLLFGWAAIAALGMAVQWFTRQVAEADPTAVV